MIVGAIISRINTTLLIPFLNNSFFYNSMTLFVIYSCSDAVMDCTHIANIQIFFNYTRMLAKKRHLIDEMPF